MSARQEFETTSGKDGFIERSKQDDKRATSPLDVFVWKGLVLRKLCKTWDRHSWKTFQRISVRLWNQFHKPS